MRDKVAIAKNKLPDDARDPVVRRIDPSDLPIVTIAVNAALDDAALYERLRAACPAVCNCSSCVTRSPRRISAARSRWLVSQRRTP